MVRCETNGYKVWDVEKEKIVVVRNIIINETNFLKSKPVIMEEINYEKSQYKTDVSDT